jgi:hypothetical protein
VKRAALACALTLCGCGWFTAGQAATATAAALERVAKLVEERTGKSLDEVPVSCEVESNPEAGEVLMLCTVKLADVKP